MIDIPRAESEGNNKHTWTENDKQRIGEALNNLGVDQRVIDLFFGGLERLADNEQVEIDNEVADVIVDLFSKHGHEIKQSEGMPNENILRGLLLATWDYVTYIHQHGFLQKKNALLEEKLRTIQGVNQGEINRLLNGIVKIHNEFGIQVLPRDIQEFIDSLDIKALELSLQKSGPDHTFGTLYGEFFADMFEKAKKRQ